jgi:hypothetical protein
LSGVTEERDHPRRRTALLRMLATALAGALGAFGVAPAAHAAPLPQAATPQHASAPDSTRR